MRGLGKTRQTCIPFHLPFSALADGVILWLITSCLAFIASWFTWILLTKALGSVWSWVLVSIRVDRVRFLFQLLVKFYWLV
jgi:hypothetical protein